MQGWWRFDRRISDQAIVTGQARVQPYFSSRADMRGALHYSEDGLLALPNGATYRSRRSYVYSKLPDGFTVWFNEPEPRLFHQVRLAAVHAGVEGSALHKCGKDLYRTAYRFEADGSFVIRHDVTGPKKGYVSITTYRPDRQAHIVQSCIGESA